MRSFEHWTEELVQRSLGESDTTPLERMAMSWKLTLESFEESKPLLVAFVESIAQAQHSDELRAQLAFHYRGSARRSLTRCAPALARRPKRSVPIRW